MAPLSFEQTIVNRSSFLQQAALKLTRNTCEAEDLVQDTLLMALRHREKFTGPRLEAWLYTIMRNGFINRYRKQKHRQQADKQLNQSVTTFQSALPNEGFSRILIKTVQQKMEQMPEIYRSPLKLRIAGYQYTEIAAITGENLGTIKSRIHMGRAMLKKMLGDIAD